MNVVGKASARSEGAGWLGRALVALVQNESEDRAGDHFAGVPEAVSRLACGSSGSLGEVECRRYTEKTVGDLGRVAGWTGGGSRGRTSARRPDRHVDFDRVVIVVKDTESPLARYVLRRAEQANRLLGEDVAKTRGSTPVRTLLLMDGIVEYRNTFLNPWVDRGFLRPAPVDVVCVCGEADAERMRGWGNLAVATGLPRLDRNPNPPASGGGAESPLPRPDQGALLVATAKRPAFNDLEWDRWRTSLTALKAALDRAGLADRVLWRLTDGLERVLGVRNSESPLAECLAQSRWVITGVSTLMVEAMLAGRFVGLIHPHLEGELWQHALVVCRGQSASDAGTIDRELLGPLLSAGPRERERQEPILRRLWAGNSDAADVSDGEPPRERAGAASTAAVNVARVLLSVARDEFTTTTFKAASQQAMATPDPGHRAERLSAVAKVVPPLVKPAGVRRVVNIVNADGTPVGGVTSWAVRMAREFASRPGLGYEVRTLLVLGSPDVLATRGFEIDHATTSVCVLDPMSDAKDRVETVRRSVEALDPDIVLPNYNDACFMACVQVRSASGGRVRMIDVAHTDVAYYRDLAACYDVWDGGVGVSSSCMAWMSRIAERGSRPVRQIVYGVPVADRPRDVPREGPLRVCYVGRMVEEQKRISLLWTVFEGLEHEGRSGGMPGGYELHMIGDGSELSAWAAELNKRTLGHGRVLIHGRRSMEWVERTLSEMDVSILVSSYEGTSISMLEAMGAGVVPCVTRVSSGVDDWLRDGDSAIVVELDDVGAMAPRLAELARDRATGGDRLARMSWSAWETARRERSLSISGMCEAYKSLFDEVLRRPLWDADASTGRPSPTDAGVRAIDTWRWTKGWQDDPAGADDWTERTLREAGFRTLISPEEAEDDRLFVPDESLEGDGATRAAVLVRGVSQDGGDHRGFAAPIDPSRVDRWRSIGLGVGISPAAMLDGGASRVWRLVRELQRDGFRRIAVYGAGRHTQRMLALFDRDRGYFDPWPWVGFIDDGARVDGAAAQLCGLPIVRLECAERVLGMDCVVLSSDVFEQQMWERTAGLRGRGVRVVRLYGAGDGDDGVVQVVSAGESVRA